jgi:hypothetical protein
MAQINTPKSIKEVVAEVMQAYKAIISNHGNYEFEYGKFEFGGE